MSSFSSSSYNPDRARLHTAAETAARSIPTGHHIWGGIDLSDTAAANRSGFMRYRLEVFAPGTNDRERHELILFRRWRAWGAIGAFLGEIFIGAIWPGWIGTLLVVFVYAGAVTYWAQRTTRIRRFTRHLTIAVVRLGGPAYVEGDAELFSSCIGALDDMDHRAADASISPVQYEALWLSVYERLAPAAS